MAGTGRVGGRIEDVRDLTAADLTGLDTARPKPVRIKRLRERHHILAKCLAAGMSNKDAGILCGLGHNRVSDLRRDPAFQQLIATYAAQPEIVSTSLGPLDMYAATVTSNGLLAEQMIADHLAQAEETEELPPIKELLAISRDAADRFGYGRQSTQVNVNVDFAAKLDRAIRRSAKGQAIIEGSALPALPPLAAPTTAEVITLEQVRPPEPNQTLALAAAGRNLRRV